jgi:hypothetical protein
MRLIPLAILLLAPLPVEDTVLVNKAKDIRVVGDRGETVTEYCQRSHLLVGGLGKDDVTKVLEAMKPLEKVFVNYASYNDDPQKGSLFGATIKIAPLAEPVAKLLKEHKPDGQKKLNLTVILRRDDKDPELFLVVGCTDRTSVGFFDDERKNEADGFSQKELRFKKR